jgi:integrase
MFKVHILDICSHCNGKVYQPIVEAEDCKGHKYTRYVPCPICEGSGNEPKWVDLEEFAKLLRQAVCRYVHTSYQGSMRSIRIIHSVLHRSLNKAVQYGLVVKNPAHGAALPKYKHAEMQVLDESQVSRFLVAAQGSRYEALYYLAITTGMRQGELFGLQWSDLHWNNGMLYVQRQSQRVAGKGWWFEEPKTRAGRRPVMIGEVILQKLREHLERQPLQKAVTGSRWQENNLIFPSTIDTPGDPSNLRVDFRKVLEKAGLPMIRFHDMRHTAASIMLNNNIPVITVSKRLGHAKPSTTLDIYGCLYPESQEEAARIMDEIITPIPL